MKHLEGLFALAQVITPDAVQAVRLVESTYQRAFSTNADFATAEHARVWLYRLMMQVHAERETASIAEFEQRESGQPFRSQDLTDFRRQLAEDYIDQAMPRAFATLTASQRMLLMMCDVERMSCEDAGRVLGVDAILACSQVEDSRTNLENAIYSDASDTERRLLKSGTPDNWRRAGLQRMADARLVTTPPTLRSSIVSVFKNLSQPQSAAAPPVETSSSKELANDDRHFGGWKKAVAVLLIVAVAGFLGYGFTNFMNREPDLNLISLSARQAKSIVPSFQTTSAEQAERYVFDRIGARVTVPTINQTALHGVAIHEIAESADVPVLLFQDAETGQPVAVYIYSYAFLDRHRDQLIVGRDILRQIEDQGNFDLHDLGEEKALIWRYRDDIFVAITFGDAEELRGRITLPS